MLKRQFVLPLACLAMLANLAVDGVRAQTAPPTAYSVTEVNSMMGFPSTMTIYRDGSKAVVDQSVPASQANPQGTHSRTLYDLQTGKTYSWDPLNASPACGSGKFSGDWGDPFAGSAEIAATLAKQHSNEAGAETVNGIATKVLETTNPGGAGKAKVWVEPKYGLVMKLEMALPNAQPQTVIEVKQVSFAAPAASLFKMPEACSQGVSAPAMPTEAERIAAETGGNAADFTNAIMPPASRNSCTVLFRILHAGSMQPIISGFQVALDRSVDLQHPGGYVIGSGAGGRATFSGGGLHEATAQLQNGVLRIDDAPAYFDMEAHFGNGGDSSALIYRQCFGPQTVLLYVVKNPAKLSDGGDWLWVKSGKFAAGATR